MKVSHVSHHLNLGDFIHTYLSQWNLKKKLTDKLHLSVTPPLAIRYDLPFPFANTSTHRHPAASILSFFPTLQKINLCWIIYQGALPHAYSTNPAIPETQHDRRRQMGLRKGKIKIVCIVITDAAKGVQCGILLGWVRGMDLWVRV